MLNTQSLMKCVEHDVKDLKMDLERVKSTIINPTSGYQWRRIVELTSEAAHVSDHKEPKMLGTEL